MLEVNGINAGYGDIQILYDISLHVKEGEIVALIGSNGAGKTTTLNAIHNTIKIYSGVVKFMEVQLGQINPYDMIMLGITHVPDGRHLFGEMTVRENLELGAYRWKDKSERVKNLEKIFAIFPKLEQRKKQLAGTLSGGEQQMLALGRGLMSQPKLLMLDEPSQGLAPLVVDELFRVVEQVNGQGIAVFLVEQNVKRALKISKRGYVLENGRIVIEGKAEDLLNNETVRKTYLGL